MYRRSVDIVVLLFAEVGALSSTPGGARSNLEFRVGAKKYDVLYSVYNFVTCLLHPYWDVCVFTS